MDPPLATILCGHQYNFQPIKEYSQKQQCHNVMVSKCMFQPNGFSTILCINDRENEAIPVRAQSGSHIYESENERHFLLFFFILDPFPKVPFRGGGGLVLVTNQLPTFDTESKNAKIPKSHFGGGGGGGGEGW